MITSTPMVRSTLTLFPFVFIDDSDVGYPLEVHAKVLPSEYQTNSGRVILEQPFEWEMSEITQSHIESSIERVLHWRDTLLPEWEKSGPDIMTWIEPVQKDFNEQADLFEELELRGPSCDGAIFLAVLSLSHNFLLQGANIYSFALPQIPESKKDKENAVTDVPKAMIVGDVVKKLSVILATYGDGRNLVVARGHKDTDPMLDALCGANTSVIYVDKLSDLLLPNHPVRRTFILPNDPCPPLRIHWPRESQRKALLDALHDEASPIVGILGAGAAGKSTLFSSVWEDLAWGTAFIGGFRIDFADILSNGHNWRSRLRSYVNQSIPETLEPDASIDTLLLALEKKQNRFLLLFENFEYALDNNNTVVDGPLVHLLERVRDERFRNIIKVLVISRIRPLFPRDAEGSLVRWIECTDMYVSSGLREKRDAIQATHPEAVETLLTFCALLTSVDANGIYSILSGKMAVAEDKEEREDEERIREVAKIENYLHVLEEKSVLERTTAGYHLIGAYRNSANTDTVWRSPEERRLYNHRSAEYLAERLDSYTTQQLRSEPDVRNSIYASRTLSGYRIEDEYFQDDMVSWIRCVGESVHGLDTESKEFAAVYQKSLVRWLSMILTAMYWFHEIAPFPVTERLSEMWKSTPFHDQDRGVAYESVRAFLAHYQKYERWRTRGSYSSRSHWLIAAGALENMRSLAGFEDLPYTSAAQYPVGDDLETRSRRRLLASLQEFYAECAFYARKQLSLTTRQILKSYAASIKVSLKDEEDAWRASYNRSELAGYYFLSGDGDRARKWLRDNLTYINREPGKVSKNRNAFLELQAAYQDHGDFDSYVWLYQQISDIAFAEGNAEVGWKAGIVTAWMALWTQGYPVYPDDYTIAVYRTSRANLLWRLWQERNNREEVMNRAYQVQSFFSKWISQFLSHNSSDKNPVITSLVNITPAMIEDAFTAIGDSDQEADRHLEELRFVDLAPIVTLLDAMCPRLPDNGDIRYFNAIRYLIGQTSSLSIREWTDSLSHAMFDWLDWPQKTSRGTKTRK